jgi:hypothetical protein
MARMNQGTPVLVTLVLTLWVLRSVALDPGSVAVGSLEVDLAAHFWVLWYAGQEAAVANAPFGADFYALEQANLWIEGALDSLMGPVGAHNAAAAIALVLAGIGGHQLGRAVSDRWTAGPLGALLLTSSPPMLEALNDGTAEFTWLGFAALALAALYRGSWWAVLWVALSGWTCWYYGLMVGFAGLVLAAWRRDPRVLVSLALGTALLLPFAISFSGSDLEVVRTELLIDEPMHRLPPWLPFGRMHLLWAAALVPAALAARRHPALATLAGLGWVLSWGSELGGVPMPFRLLNHALDTVARPLHLPFHFMALTTLAVVPLACAGRARPWMVVVAIAAVVAPAPAGSVLPEPAPLVALQSAQQPAGAVLELPGLWRDEQSDLDREALHQLVHQRPIPRFPVFPTDQLRHEGIDALRNDPWVQGLQRGEAGTPDLPGYAWVILGPDGSPELNEALQNSLGAPRFEGDGLSVFALR